MKPAKGRWAAAETQDYCGPIACVFWRLPETLAEITLRRGVKPFGSGLNPVNVGSLVCYLIGGRKPLWRHLTKGEPAYLMGQVSVSDLIMLVLLVPLVPFLVPGASSLTARFGNEFTQG